MTDDAAILEAIRLEPAEDVHRLAYADLLTENGQPERGEFIRVQCATARAVADRLSRDKAFTLGHVCTDAGCEVCVGRRADRRLLKRNWQEWFPWATGYGTNTAYVAVAGVVQVENNSATIARVRFARGFADDVTLPAEKWVEYGDAIVAANLVEEVTLTTMPDVETNGRLFSERQRRLIGRQTWYWDRGDRTPNWSAPEATARGIVKGLLGAEWRSVKTWNVPQNASDALRPEVMEAFRRARERATS